MAQAKFWKRKDQLSQTEEAVAKTIIEIENSSSELKAELKDLYLDSVKEIELKGKKSKNVLLVFIPFICAKILQKCVKKFLQELESKWIKPHRSQIRPRSRTLTSVHDAILDDLLQPTVIIGRRIRYRLDGSKFYKIFLDVNDKEVMEDKIETIAQLYKQLTAKEIVIEFRKDEVYYDIKKF